VTILRMIRANSRHGVSALVTNCIVVTNDLADASCSSDVVALVVFEFIAIAADCVNKSTDLFSYI
jgi:hypothetical protein